MDNNEEKKDIVEEPETGTIERVEIDRTMRTSYIDYSMSVIVSRALPDVRDGLKPVQRRVVFGMDKMGVTYTSQTRKSARIVGDVMGKFHPHGDSSVYDAMVRLGQWWNQRYPLVWGQGNFGSMDGDPVAAMSNIPSASDGYQWIVYTFHDQPGAPLYSLLYIVWFCALWLHMNHGFWSGIQTLGWSGKIWLNRWQCIGFIWSTIVVLMFAVVVVKFAVFG